jgi:hypothetical protein
MKNVVSADPVEHKAYLHKRLEHLSQGNPVVYKKLLLEWIAGDTRIIVGEATFIDYLRTGIVDNKDKHEAALFELELEQELLRECEQREKEA